MYCHMATGQEWIVIGDVSWTLTAVSKCSPASASAVSDPASGTAHLPPHASQAGKAFVQGQQQGGQHSRAPSSGDTGTKNELAHLFA